MENKNLTEEQYAAVHAKQDKIVVTACPGSGKTTVITERVKHLLAIGVKPKDIVAITFTNLAAQEMQLRVNCTDNDLFIGTIHAYANKQLKNIGINGTSYIRGTNFDILLKLCLNKELTLKSKHVLIDETQDLSLLEYDFIFHLPTKNRFFVGDQNQAIYGFKGGCVDAMSKLAYERGYTEYPLTINFRTPDIIFNFAKNQLPPHHYDIGDVFCSTEIHGRISRSTYINAMQGIKNAGNYKDWFVLARTNKEVNILKQKLSSLDVPYVSFAKSECTLEEIKKYLEGDMVKVLTIHMAKGLESPNVVVIGTRTWDDEEFRISYVAATRASKKLIWCPAIQFEKKKKPTKIRKGFH